MSLRVRDALAWILLALFGGIASIGQGLHFLPGLGHFPATSHSVRHGCQGHDCSKRAWAPPGHNGPSFVGVHDCPICKYFALVKRVPMAARVLRDHTVLSEPPVLSLRLVSRQAARVYDSRGPPTGTSIA